MNIRVLLVDDHAIVREGLRTMLEREPGMKVVGVADDGRTALKLAAELNPDLVVMDIGMPGMNGIEATRQIIRDLDHCKIICLSMHNERKFVRAMLDAGASAYVLKSEAPRKLVSAIQAVMEGRKYLSPSIDRDIVSTINRDPAEKTDIYAVLSDREREVLQLIAEGHSSKLIAARLGLSDKTISSHREHIMAKLKLHSVADLTRYALREGITQL